VGLALMSDRFCGSSASEILSSQSVELPTHQRQKHVNKLINESDEQMSYSHA